MPGEIAAAAITGGTQIAGGLLGMIGQKKREQRAMTNQKQLMDIQFRNQKLLNQQGQQLQLDTWKKTNYPAQMAMLKEAGLNPGLLYGQSGGGGTTTGSQGGGSAASGAAPAPQQWPMDLNAQIALKTAAEISLIRAQELKTRAEAEKTAGVDTEESKTRIQKIIAETTNEQIKTKLLNIETDIQEIERANRQYKIESEIANTLENTKKLKLENSITTDQYDNICKQIEESAKFAVLNNQLTESKVDLTDTQKQQIITSIVQKWTDLNLTERQVSAQEKNAQISEFEAEIRAEYPGMWNVIGSVLKKAYDSLENIELWIRRKRIKTDELE